MIFCVPSAQHRKNSAVSAGVNSAHWVTSCLHEKVPPIPHTVMMTEEDIMRRLQELAAQCLPNASAEEHAQFIAQVEELYRRLRTLLDETI
jgi:hypothetical protein